MKPPARKTPARHDRSRPVGRSHSRQRARPSTAKMRSGRPIRQRQPPAAHRRPGRPVRGQRGGLAVELAVRTFNRPVRRVVRKAIITAPKGLKDRPFPRAQDRERAANRFTRGLDRRSLAGLLAAIGHPQRLTILIKLLGGEATHRLLAKATSLKAGPLYYHVRELRSAGLIGPKVRDLYVLTGRGETVTLAAVAMGEL